MAFFSLAISSSAILYFYTIMRDSIWTQTGVRLKDVGRTGLFLFTPEHREAVRRLRDLYNKEAEKVTQETIAEIEEGDIYETIDASRAEEIHKSRDFQMLIQAMRKIRAGSLKDPVYPEFLNQMLNQPEDAEQATIKYVYMLAPIEQKPDYTTVVFLGDADYEAIDMNGNGEIDADEEPVSFGMLYKIEEQQELQRAFRENTITVSKTYTEDSWGTWYSAHIPLRDSEGNLIAIMGLDIDVLSELNLVQGMQNLAFTLLAVITIITGLIAYIIGWFFARPVSKLRAGAERVKERDFSVRVDVKSRDELGTLASAFNSMVKEIGDYSTNLEALVAERTNKLEQTLEEVQKLKHQQDGDYYLSTLLANPLFKNRNRSNSVNIDFSLDQKKKFSFKRWKAALGGDLCLAGNLNFDGRVWIMFFNGDAMGKSMQGAGGALVMGSVLNAIMARSAADGRVLEMEPKEWMMASYNEIQRVFETFDGSMFVSGVIGLINEQTGYMYYLNAEHPFSVIYRNGTAQFLEEEISTSKFGVPFESDVQIFEYQLEPGDVIITGSDGRDDLILYSDDSRSINSDETLFLEAVRQAGAKLKPLKEYIEKQGELTDDLSLMRIEFAGKHAQIHDPASEQDAVNRTASSGAEQIRNIAGFIKERRYSEALEEIEKSGDHSPAMLYYRSLCLARLGRPEEAAETLAGAGAILDEKAAAAKLLGKIYFQLGRYEEAGQFFEKALFLDPSDMKSREAIDKIRMALS